MSELKFDEYRIHFRKLQGDMFNDPNVRFGEKNKLLDEIIKTELQFKKKDKVLKYKHTDLTGNYHHLKIANKKVTKIEKDFERQNIDNEPSANIFIWNIAEEQKVLIESDKTSFNDSKAVAKIIENELNRKFKKYALALTIAPEIEESEFWALVKTYENRITKIQFNFLYPNLPKTTSTVAAELKEAFESIGSPKGSLEFKAEKDSTLKNLNENNEKIRELNSASSMQGQPIIIKIKDKKGSKRTGKTQKTISIPQEIINNEPAFLLNLVKTLLDSQND